MVDNYYCKTSLFLKYDPDVTAVWNKVILSAHIIPQMMLSYVRCSKYVSPCFWLTDKLVTSSRFYEVLWRSVISIQIYFEIFIRHYAMKISSCAHCKRFEVWCEKDASWSNLQNIWLENLIWNHFEGFKSLLYDILFSNYEKITKTVWKKIKDFP